MQHWKELEEEEAKNKCSGGNISIVGAGSNEAVSFLLYALMTTRTPVIRVRSIHFILCTMLYKCLKGAGHLKAAFSTQRLSLSPAFFFDKRNTSQCPEMMYRIAMRVLS